MSGKKISITLLGKKHQLFCPAGEEAALHRSVEYLETRLQESSEKASLLSYERVLMITALNMANELLRAEINKAQVDMELHQRISALHENIDQLLLQQRQMELPD